MSNELNIARKQMRNDKTSFQKLKYVYDNEIIQIYKNITLLTVSAFPLSSVVYYLKLFYEFKFEENSLLRFFIFELVSASTI